jgi:hypothetical protein
MAPTHLLADVQSDHLSGGSWPVSNLERGRERGQRPAKNRKCKYSFFGGWYPSPWATVRPMPSMTGGADVALQQYAGPVRPD